MWIQTNSNTKRLKSEHTDGEFVEFAENGAAQVTEAVGTALIENYSEITEKS